MVALSKIGVASRACERGENMRSKLMLIEYRAIAAILAQTQDMVVLVTYSSVEGHHSSFSLSISINPCMEITCGRRASPRTYRLSQCTV